jgi:hypothetical protein
MVRPRFIDKDRGWKRLRRELRKSIRKPHVVVGIFGDAASEPKQKSPKLTNAQVASVHEFGLGNVPERSFIRGTVDERAKGISRIARKGARAVLAGTATTRFALEVLGIFVQGAIRRRISRGIPPPLKEATKRRKGSSMPLIDTGQLRGSIDYEVRNA